MSSKVASAITDKMTSTWTTALAHASPAPAVTPTNSLSAKESFLRGLRLFWRDYLGPALSAVAIVYVIVTLSDRSFFTAFDQAGLVCKATDQPSDIPEKGILISFDISDPCFATAYKVGRLDRYLIWTTPDMVALNRRFPGYVVKPGTCAASPDEKLMNRNVAADAHGYETFRNERGPTLTWWQTFWNALLLPMKRHYGQPWLQPVARYGTIGNEVDFLEADPDPRVSTISENVTPKSARRALSLL
jgi:hypothetical protein